MIRYFFFDNMISNGIKYEIGKWYRLPLKYDDNKHKNINNLLLKNNNDFNFRLSSSDQPICSNIYEVNVNKKDNSFKILKEINYNQSFSDFKYLEYKYYNACLLAAIKKNDKRFLKYRKKEGYRTIALNRESVEAIENYIVELKREYPGIKDDSKLFLNHDGEGISRQGFWKIFKKRQQDLGLTKELNTMNFRNSLAIHLLEDKVPAEEVQELLGLKNINSLKLYFSSLEGNKSKRMMTNHPRKTIN